MSDMHRRDTLRALVALPLASAACRKVERVMTTAKLPVLFLAHGAPPLLDDPQWMGELATWAKAMPTPKAVLMLSAHWESRPLSIGATEPKPLIYDFGGFEDRFYRLQYPSPGAPELATRVKALLDAKGVPHVDAPTRGLDHGAYIPLMAMYPQAQLPVLQVSLPSQDPKALLAVGQALAPLRDEGVLITGSGFITHNLRAGWRGLEPWAQDFDGWVQEKLVARDVDALLDYRAKAPGVNESLPTHEHFVPLLVSMGAAGQSPKVRFPIDGWWMGLSFSKRSVQLD